MPHMKTYYKILEYTLTLSSFSATPLFAQQTGPITPFTVADSVAHSSFMLPFELNIPVINDSSFINQTNPRTFGDKVKSLVNQFSSSKISVGYQYGLVPGY